jgi:hypothetical protein
MMKSNASESGIGASPGERQPVLETDQQASRLPGEILAQHVKAGTERNGTFPVMPCSSHGAESAAIILQGETMSIGTIILIILVLILLGGVGGIGGSPFYGTGYYGGGGLGLVIVILLILVLMGRL